MDERSIPATPQRRSRLAEQGRAARSQELTSALTFLALISLAAASVSGLFQWFENFVRQAWTVKVADVANVESLQSSLANVIYQMVAVFGTAAGLCLLISLSINYLQTGRFWFGFSMSRRVSPIAALSGMFSFHNATSVILSIAKVLVLLTLIGLVVKNDAGQILAAGDTTPAGFLASCSSIVFKSSFVAAVTFLVFAGIDYWRQWLRHEQQIKMTPQEFRDEMRESQGDPQMAATRRVLYEQVNSIGQTNVGLEIADSRQRRHSPDQRTNSGDSDLVSEK